MYCVLLYSYTGRVKDSCGFVRCQVLCCMKKLTCQRVQQDCKHGYKWSHTNNKWAYVALSYRALSDTIMQHKFNELLKLLRAVQQEFLKTAEALPNHKSRFQLLNLYSWQLPWWKYFSQSGPLVQLLSGSRVPLHSQYYHFNNNIIWMSLHVDLSASVRM